MHVGTAKVSFADALGPMRQERASLERWAVRPYGLGMPFLTLEPSAPLVERERRFWRDVIAWSTSVTPLIVPRVLLFGLYGIAIGLAHEVLDWERLGTVPAQFTAAILVLLLVFRTNAGYDRWWEARKLWGGIVNQSRNLALAGLTYGPADEGWRQSFARWAAAFSHASRRSLRSEREGTELLALLGEEEAHRLFSAQHMPSYAARRVASLLRTAVQTGDLDRFAFWSAEQERAMLVNHIGGCERILRTPLPHVHTVKLRRFLVLYLVWLPFAAVGDSWWLPGLVTALVAYPLLAIDEIAVELVNPFSQTNLSHLPLDDICRTIESNVLALLEEPAPGEPPREGRVGPLRAPPAVH